MRLKKPHQFGSWVFFIGEENEQDSNLLRIPLEGQYRTRSQLVSAVKATFENLSQQGKPEFLNAATEEAKMMKMTYDAYLAVLVEHQICIRAGGTSGGLCAPSGKGDKLHSYAEAIDRKFDKAPKKVKSAYQKVVSATLSVVNKTKEKVVRLSGCSSCGGRKSFSGKGKNMGRAGRMQ